MTVCVSQNTLPKYCLLIFISHAFVASQKMEKTETMGARLNFDTLQDIFRDRVIFKSSENIVKPGINENLNYLKTFSFIGYKRKKKQSRVLNDCLGEGKSVNKRKQCKYILSQYLFNIDPKIKHINTFKHLESYMNIKFRNRKLLSKSQQQRKNVPKLANLGMSDSEIKEMRSRAKQRTESVRLNISENVSNASKLNLEKLALQELKEYQEFVSMMEQTFSKDPLRAMLSVSFLMIVMMLAIKLCGMKPVKQERENLDFHENVHYVNIHDILKRKRPYLPKYLLTWERRLRRKFKRRQRIKRVHEREQTENVISDNSEEEMLIYGGNCDF